MRFEVADVVDAANDHAPIAFLDQRDGRVLDAKRKQAAARLADDAVQRDLDDPSVGDHEHVAVRVTPKERVDGGGHPGFEVRLPLTTWHNVPVRLVYPPRPRLGVTLGDLVRPQPFPLAEEDLAQGPFGLRRDADAAAEYLRRLERTRKVARVVAGELPACQPRGQELGLTATVGRKGRVELALNAVLAVPRGLAVADEKKARRSWTWG